MAGGTAFKPPEPCFQLSWPFVRDAARGREPTGTLPCSNRELVEVFTAAVLSQAYGKK